MAKIFISYRREDRIARAGRIEDSAHFVRREIQSLDSVIKP